MKVKKLLVLALGFALILAVLSACGQSDEPDSPGTDEGAATPAETAQQETGETADAPEEPAESDRDKYGGTLRYALPYSPGSPMGIPWQISGPTAYSSALCIEPLLKELSDTTILPNLAESYELDTTPSEASITFYLRQDVKFHDGTDFNAEAVKWNLEMQKEPGGANTGIAEAWQSIEVVDEYTVKVHVGDWQNDMMYGFADSSAFMVSPTAYAEHGEEWMQYNMVGTGPFIQAEYESEVSLTVTRNPDYWQDGKPYVDEIVMLYVTDDLTRKMLFETGGCDILSNGRNTTLANELAEAGYTVEVKSGNGNFALWPDSLNGDSPWSDIRVRMAAEYALDKEQMAEKFGYGYLVPLYQFTSPVQIGYDPDIPQRSYDVEKARELLAEAGYPDGFETTIIVSTNVTDRDTVIAIQAYLADVGINCNIEYPTSSAYNQIYAGGTWNNALIYTPVNFRANPNISFKQFLADSSPYFQSLKRPDGIDDLIEQSLNTPLPDADLIREINRVLADDITMITITDSSFPWILADNVRDAGLGIYSTGSYFDPENVWLEK